MRTTAYPSVVGQWDTLVNFYGSHVWVYMDHFALTCGKCVCIDKLFCSDTLLMYACGPIPTSEAIPGNKLMIFFETELRFHRSVNA